VVIHTPPTLRAIARPAAVVTGEPDIEDQHDRFWEVLLRELKSEAMAVREELDCQGVGGDSEALLERIARGSKRALGRAMRFLENMYGEGQARELVEQRRREMERIVPALMLLPEMGLLDLLIAEAEKSSDENLLKRLRSLGEIIEGMERVDDAAAWRDIARRIRRLTA
jgi:hypothetical protein